MGQRFSHRLRVRFNECDPQGVVFYANYLTYLDIAMTELWREACGGYAEMIDAGTDIMVAEANIRYRGSARFDDDIDLVAQVDVLGMTSSVITVDVERAADGAVLAAGRLRHVFVDARTLEKREIPPRVREGLARYLAEPEAVPG